MKNKVFNEKSAVEKRRYLSDVLKYAAGGVLDDGMIGRILPKVVIHKQYAIVTYDNNHAFQEAVARAQKGKVRTSAVFSRTGNGAAAVVVTPLSHTDSKNSGRVIYIHTPILHAGKGARK